MAAPVALGKCLHKFGCILAPRSVYPLYSFRMWTPRTYICRFCIAGGQNRSFQYSRHFSSLDTHRIAGWSSKIWNFSPCLRLFHSSLMSRTKTNITGQGITSEILKNRYGESEQAQSKAEEPEPPKETKKRWYSKYFSAQHGWKVGLFFLFFSGSVLSLEILFLWGKPAIDGTGEEIPDEFTLLPKWEAYTKRAYKELLMWKQAIQDPSDTKLLPDPVKPPYIQPPYTLVLEMKGVLVHPDWTMSTGWRFKKRPGVELFLKMIGPMNFGMFETVIYTKEPGMTAFPIIEQLDSEGNIMFRLFRDATRYMKGAHVKDVSHLNRDERKVIVIDCDPGAVQLQPRNALVLPEWKGNNDDRTLLELGSFLRTIATMQPEDVRTVLDYYNESDNPLETFKENQAKLAEQEAQRQAAPVQKPKSWLFGR